MTTDFKATQVQTNKIIVTGSFAGDGSNQLLIYNYAADDSGSPNQGQIDPTKFDTTSGIGSDVFLFVSGGVATRGTGGSYGVTVIGGDLHVSGNLTVDGTSPGGGGGGGGNEYWESAVAGEIFATGSLVAVTGSLWASFLSASNGLEITGSFSHGTNTSASSTNSHAQGDSTTASGNYSHAEGSGTTASASGAHSEGVLTHASAQGSHAEGYNTTASGDYSHAEGDSTTASGESSHAEGAITIASGQYSHAEGESTTASGYASHAEGESTTASGDYSHAEGASGGPGGSLIASGYASHAEGYNTTASGQHSHAEGETTIAGGYGSHAEGQFSIATGSYSHAEGFNTLSSGTFSHAEGYYTTGSGNFSHSEGDHTLASGNGSHAEGFYTTASINIAHAEGAYSKALGAASHAEGTYTIADGITSHAEGWGSATHLRGFTVVYVDSDGVDPANGIFQLDSVYGDITTDIQNASNITSRMVTDGDIAGGFIGDRRVYDFVGTNFESSNTWITCSNPYGMSPLTAIPYAGSIIASFAPLEWQLSNLTTPPDQAITGTISHAEGIESISIGSGSHAEGFRTLAIGVSKDLTSNSPGAATWGAHAEGLGTIAYGNTSHSEGVLTIASGEASHAEGVYTTASGDASHAEGDSTTASGYASHAEGDSTIASGDYSHAEGVYTTASGDASHAEGDSTTASGYASHAEGIFTIASGSGQLAAGKYNQRNNDFSIFVIGDGTADDDASRSDIVRVNSGTLPGSGSFEVTGTIRSTLGFSGSLTQLTNGTPYLIAGTGIQTSTGSNGAVTISTAGSSGLATGKQYLAPYTATTSTTTLAIGQFSWVPADYVGLTSVTVRAIMSTDGTANHTGSLQVHNLTSGSYLDLVDTPSVGTFFEITSSIPTLVTSSNLLTGITNFDNSSTSVYEVRVSGSLASSTFVGGVELVFG